MIERASTDYRRAELYGENDALAGPRLIYCRSRVARDDVLTIIRMVKWYVYLGNLFPASPRHGSIRTP